jgi:hypothetical protein
MADEDKLVKAGVEAALKPFADLLEKLAGPAAEEIGLTLKDHVRVFRLNRQLRLFERTKEMLEQAGIDPSRVPLKLLSPIIESASLEEDNELQDRWAALLANASSQPEGIHPSFVDVLRQLTSMDVLVLDVMFDLLPEDKKAERDLNDGQLLEEMAARLGWGKMDTPKAYWTMKEKLRESRASSNLGRLGLLVVEGVDPEQSPCYTLTKYGEAFCAACRAPKAEQ